MEMEDGVRLAAEFGAVVMTAKNDPIITRAISTTTSRKPGLPAMCSDGNPVLRILRKFLGEARPRCRLWCLHAPFLLTNGRRLVAPAADPAVETKTARTETREMREGTPWVPLSLLPHEVQPRLHLPRLEPENRLFGSRAWESHHRLVPYRPHPIRRPGLCDHRGIPVVANGLHHPTRRSRSGVYLWSGETKDETRFHHGLAARPRGSSPGSACYG
jgi:hypothetical protein